MARRSEVDPSGSYRSYEQDHDYDYDGGVIPIPTSGSTPQFVSIRVHGGFGMRTVKWSTSRNDKPPIIPEMVNLEGDTFLSGNVQFALPQPNPQSGSMSWHVAGEYRYVQSSPRLVGTGVFTTGRVPYYTPGVDGIASTILAPLVVGAATLTSVSTALAATVDHNNGNYLWPFSFHSPVFTSSGVIA